MCMECVHVVQAAVAVATAGIPLGCKWWQKYTNYRYTHKPPQVIGFSPEVLHDGKVGIQDGR